ncbi:MAG: glycosyltransferase [Proteobacteria bacterium]|nr:glycosyltransferase [Pseudomonadota bacterium]
MTQPSAPPTIVEALYSYDIGGGERVAADAALGFARRGYRVVCFGMYGNDGPLRQEIEAAGIPCFDYQYTSRMRLTRRFTYPLELARFLKREHVAGLHTHYGAALDIGGRGWRLASVPRVVVTEHALHQYQARPKYRATTARLLHRADAITVVHPDQIEYFINEMGAPRSLMHHVANGVVVPAETPRREPSVRQEFGANNDDFLFIAVGRLNETKDIPTLVEAFGMLSSKTQQPLRLWLVGDGEDRPRIEQTIANLQLGSSVTLLGARSDVLRLLPAADALVMSSLTEGLPMALIEAMANRVPCVATAVGGIPNLLRDGAGLTAPASNPAALSDAMLQLVIDPALRQTIVQRAVARVRADHDIESTITQYLELLGLPPNWPPPPAASGFRQPVA